MKTEKVSVSYRDKSTSTNISLGEIEVGVPETVAEAVDLFGEEDLIAYATKAFIIEEQRKHRDANRPDRPKTTSLLAKFKQLTPEQQEVLLASSGVGA